jgi:ferredoxin/copper chaperone CopZ
MHRLRRLFQIGILAAALTVGIRHAIGLSRITVETYCPFGGLAGMLSLISNKQFTCATGERNLILFIALVVLTILSRRVFCSWICPVGSISEGILWVSRKLGIGKKEDRAGEGTLIPRKWDRILRWVRLPILAVILILTYKTGELIFRGFDPYYIMFSIHGHDVMWCSYIVIGIILVTVFMVPMAWCRYLCPLGGALWPISRIGALRIARSERCIDCGKCDVVCPWGLEVSTCTDVTSGECTLCMECTRNCPVDGALELGLPAGKVKVSQWLIPILIVMGTLAGVYGSRLIHIPSAEMVFNEEKSGTKISRAVFIVDGVTCRDTALSVMNNLKTVEGVHSVVAYASHNRIDVAFDPEITAPVLIGQSMEDPVFIEDTGEFLFNIYRVVEINGEPVELSK